MLIDGHLAPNHAEMNAVMVLDVSEQEADKDLLTLTRLRRGRISGRSPGIRALLEPVQTISIRGGGLFRRSRRPGMSKLMHPHEGVSEAEAGSRPREADELPGEMGH